MDANPVIQYPYAVASGRAPTSSLFTFFGYRANIPTSETNQQWWDGPAQGTVYKTAAESMRVFSSNANDTAAGTGAQTVVVIACDANFNLVTQVVTLNGTGSVTLPTPIFPPNTFVVVGAGSNRVNIGNLRLETVAGSQAVGWIRAGAGLSMLGGMIVPAGYTFASENFFFNAAMQLGNNTNQPHPVLKIQGYASDLTTGVILKTLPVTLSMGNPMPIVVPSSYAVPEKNRIWYEIVSVSDSGMDASTGVSGIFVQNPV